MSSLLGNIFGVADKTKAGVQVLQLQTLLGRAQGPGRAGGGCGLCRCGCSVPWVCACPPCPILGCPARGSPHLSWARAPPHTETPGGLRDEIHPCTESHKPRHGSSIPSSPAPQPCPVQPPAASPRLELSPGPFSLLPRLLPWRPPVPPFVCPGTRSRCWFMVWGTGEAPIPPQGGKEQVPN